MKRRKRTIQTPEQKWSFKRHFQNKGILTSIRTQIIQMIQYNNKKNIRPILTGQEIVVLCSIQDQLNILLKKYSERTNILKELKY